jgi:hypothetical protein
MDTTQYVIDPPKYLIFFLLHHRIIYYLISKNILFLSLQFYQHMDENLI